MDNQHIIVFDGVCNFCNNSVNFIIARDPDAIFIFTPIQSVVAQELMEKYDVSDMGLETFLLVKNNQCYVSSTAAIEIAGDLAGWWSLLGTFKFVPRVFRDFVYKIIARNRYKLFGKRNVCMVPTAELKSRFIGV